MKQNTLLALAAALGPGSGAAPARAPQPTAIATITSSTPPRSSPQAARRQQPSGRPQRGFVK